MSSEQIHEKNPILSLENISYSYHTLSGETHALKDITFSIYPGEFIAIVGPSGCGKSTLLNIIAGLIKANKGKLYFHQKEITNTLSPYELKIGYMLQQDHLLPWRTIFQNIILGLEINHNITEENIEHVYSLLQKYGLYDFKDQKPYQLSGGMRQRAALIRTLALNPEILLLDEPFSALDYQTRLSVSGDIGKIIRENKKTAILVTHNLSEAISLADRIIVFTNRPATIKRQVPILLTITDNSPLGYRAAPEFNDYFNEIWGDLCHEYTNS